jgi:hypothetical protein
MLQAYAMLMNLLEQYAKEEEAAAQAQAAAPAEPPQP